MQQTQRFDVVVVGGGPAGATAANELAMAGYNVALLDKAGRIKPCGGAVPPRLVKDFDIPAHLIEARAKCARMVSPKGVEVDMPIDGGYVGMVDRQSFDEWLRERAASAGATRLQGKFLKIEPLPADHIADASEQDCLVCFQPTHKSGSNTVPEQEGINNKRSTVNIQTRYIIGADGANSAVGKNTIRGADSIAYVSAYHEIVKSPPSRQSSDLAANDSNFDPARCDVYYQGKVSPDFYGWVFPHGDVTSIGVGSAVKGFKLRKATQQLRESAGMTNNETVRCEGAPIPLKVLKRWDNGKNVILCGDAAGVVAPASGEGIYYAMRSGRLVASAVEQCLVAGDPGHLRDARKAFMKECGKVFFILGMMQKFWYRSDRLREKFVHICRDEDVQRLTWESYMNKELVRKKPMAHVRIFFKDLAHLCGVAQVK